MSLPPDPAAFPASVLAESEARTLLRACPARDGLEGWLAEEPSQAAIDGSWRVERDREGWTYRVEGVPGRAVRVVAHTPESGPVTAWLVTP